MEISCQNYIHQKATFSSIIYIIDFNTFESLEHEILSLKNFKYIKNNLII